MNIQGKISFSLAITTAVILFPILSTNAYAGTRTFDCSFLTQHSSTEVAMALSYAKSVVGADETNKLYGHYMALKNECRGNPSAHRSVHLSDEMVSLISTR